jgi:hypothetical protein
MFNSGSQPDMASLHTCHSNASHIETLRKNGEAIADAVAAHMLIHATDHHHEVIRKKGTFKVTEEEDCSRCIKEIVRKRYQTPSSTSKNLATAYESCTFWTDLLLGAVKCFVFRFHYNGICQ